MFHLLRSLVLVPIASAAIAQSCRLEWTAGDPVPYARGSVIASAVWDADGTGPAPSLLVCGGEFSAGTLVDVPIAAYDGSQWLPLGTPAGIRVTALTVSNGQLIAASLNANGFTTVASWSGTAWLTMGVSYGFVRTMTTHAGSLYIGGSFTGVTGTAAANVARFDGTAWSALGSGTNGPVSTLASFNGALHVGGSFTSAGGVTVSNYALWNSPSWFSGVWFNGEVQTFAVRSTIATSQTYLFAGGAFTAAGATPALRVARLTQSTNTWTAMANGLPGTTCCRLFVRTFGMSSFELTAAVEGDPDEIWRWNGSTWAPLGNFYDGDPMALPRTFAFYGGRYILGLSNGGRAVRAFDGQEWPPLLGLGIDEVVSTSLSIGSEFVIGGRFKTISGTVMNGIARGNPGAWQPLGSGLEGGVGVLALARMPNGDLVAGGNFTTAGGVPAANLARWNGTAWSQFGGGVNGTVHALVVMPNGDLVAAGQFPSAGGLARNAIARWNGSTWLALGSGTAGTIIALHLAADGQLYAGGTFTSIGGIAASRIARWNGSSWSSLGSGPDSVVYSIATAPNGDVVIGGSFDNTDGIVTPHVARWNGTAWGAVGTTSFFYPEDIVYAVAVLPDGDIVAAGTPWSWGIPLPGLPSGTTRGMVARYREGAMSWGTLGVEGSSVGHLRVLPEGGLVIGGAFRDAGGPTAHFAKLVPTCPATAQSVGSGCNGDTLTATSLPWVESTFRAVGTGLPGVSLVIKVTGFASVPQGLVPLASILAPGLPGCDLLVTADLLDFEITTNGTAMTQFVLPNSPAIVGVPFFHQMVPIAVDAAGAWTAVTATNALRLTAGVF
ncbi:MAG: hypothetical protein MUC36_25265 [Planctomycetes bacterium]|jgi:hypothetical protein|nr:hypothetical protein [Planctomycetota bacterium]